MNLLSLLLSAYLSSQSLGSLSNNTGVQQSQLKKLLILALPLLIKYMTSNSQSQSGLSSLFGALGQHQSRSSVSDQIESADVEDGNKIIGHILGDDESDVLKSLSNETGLDMGDIANVLGTIAPSLMSGVSAATQTAQTQQQAGVDLSDGLDLGDLLSLFGGAASQPAPQAAPANDGTQLINALLSMM